METEAVVRWSWLPPATGSLDVDGHAFDAGESVEEGFGEGGVGMDGERHLFDGGFELHRYDALGDKLGGLRADDVDAEDFAVFGVGDDFNEAVVRVDDGCLGVTGEGELANLDLVALFLGLRLGEAYAADLGVAVGAAGDAVLPHWTRVLAGELACDDYAAHCADVRQLRESGDDVADGIHALLGGLHPLVHRDEAPVELDVGLVEADIVGARSAADCDL